MRVAQLLVAGFLLAATMFVTTMLVSPPISEAAATNGGAVPTSTPIELVGP